MTRAVAYIGTPGYLFHTMLSAAQAVRRVDHDTQVHVVALTQPGVAEAELSVMAGVAQAHGVIMHRVGRDLLGGLSPVFGRLFLDEVLPADVDTVLYLDCDTQIRGPLSPLLDHTLERGRLAAVRDPMAAIRRTHRSLRRRIDQAWDAAGIPVQARAGYVNAGMLLFHRADLAGFRERALAANAERGARFTFLDQDALNTALWDVIDHVGLEWNYPGFLLGVDWPTRDAARVVHYMSDPRPWHGSYRPWGAESHRPYAELVRRHPELAPYWDRPGATRALRNHAQQLYKACTEGRHWRSAPFRAALDQVYPGLEPRVPSPASGPGR